MVRLVTRYPLLFVVLMSYILIAIYVTRRQRYCIDSQEVRQQIRALKARHEGNQDKADGEERGHLNKPLSFLGIQGPLVEDRGGKDDHGDGPLGLMKAAGIDKDQQAQVINDLHNLDLLPVSTLLNPNMAPNTVYFIWCGSRWFEFQHYLSVMSVIREIRPDNIVFYYDIAPVMDKWTYNTWYKELQEDYPFFRVAPFSDEIRDIACLDFDKPNITYIYDLLTKRGGMYVSEHTIITRFPVQFRNYSFIDALNKTNCHGLMASKPGLPGKLSPKEVLADDRFPSKTYKCGTVGSYLEAKKKPLCISDPYPLFPKDMWERDDDYGRLTRRVFYGSPEITPPKPSYDDLIPNIAHIVWIGGGKMDFLFYLCVLSLIYVAEVDNVYIHGDAPPHGRYWDSISHHPKINVIYRATPKTIYGNPVHVLSHVTDVWRVDFMVKYGGIYVDTDTAFVRPLDTHIRGYDAVGTYDWTYWNHPFPDTINFGVAIGKRNARYWHMFQDSMKWFMDKDWSWNGLRQPYRIKERHPESILINPRLQVTCYQFKCHPTWWPNYHNESIHHLNSPSIKDWRNDVYAFHWTMPTPPELKNKTALLKSDTMFGEIGRYILEKAGRLNDTNSLY